jgi:Zn finger protein HypA/HybF involved in hydrogenase expression
VHSLILEDHRLTVREIADKVRISTGSAHSIVTEDLHMCRVVAKFVPKLLLQEQQLRLEVVRDMLECANCDPEFLKTVITGEETWVYGHDLETKVQSLQWKHSSSPKPKKSTTGAEQSQGAADCFL